MPLHVGALSALRSAGCGPTQRLWVVWSAKSCGHRGFPGVGARHAARPVQEPLPAGEEDIINLTVGGRNQNQAGRCDRGAAGRTVVVRGLSEMTLRLKLQSRWSGTASWGSRARTFEGRGGDHVAERSEQGDVVREGGGGRVRATPQGLRSQGKELGFILSPGRPWRGLSACPSNGDREWRRPRAPTFPSLPHQKAA